MKKLLFPLPLLFFFLSCSSDDDHKLDHPIVGKWIFTEVKYDMDVDNSNLAADIRVWLNDMYSELSGDFLTSTSFEFKSNSNVKITIPNVGELDNIPFSIKGNIITIYMPGEDPESTEFTIVDNELRFIDDMTEDALDEFSHRYPQASIKHVKTIEIMRRK